MSEVNLFEAASRLKLRFDTPKGNISTEDLWDLPLTSKTGRANLDTIAQGLFAQLQSTSNISFVVKEQKANPEVQLKFDLVKYVIDTIIAENEVKNKAAENAEKKQRLLGIIAVKENEQLLGSSLDDLKQMAASL